MEKLEVGEIAVIEDNKEYIVFSRLNDNGFDYVYLMSNFKPLEIKFAKQILNGDNLELEIVSNKEEKQRLLTLFKQNNK